MERPTYLNRKVRPVLAAPLHPLPGTRCERHQFPAVFVLYPAVPKEFSPRLDVREESRLKDRYGICRVLSPHQFLHQPVHTRNERLAIAINDTCCLQQAQAKKPTQNISPWVWMTWFRISAE